MLRLEIEHGRLAGAHKASKGEISKDLFPLNPQSHQKRIRDLEKKIDWKSAKIEWNLTGI
jgi:hypothetical protein